MSAEAVLPPVNEAQLMTDEERAAIEERVAREIATAPQDKAPVQRMQEALARIATVNGGLLSFGELARNGITSAFVFIFANGSTLRLEMQPLGLMHHDESVVGVVHTARHIRLSHGDLCEQAQPGKDGAQ